MLVGVAALAACVSATAKSAVPTPSFPPNGASYAEARRLLLSEGLRMAPDRPLRPDRRHRELDCDNRFAVEGACRALFLFRRNDGWRDYVVLLVNRSDLRVIHTDFARHMDGLPSIPPPRPADVPKLTGTYSMARAKLGALGYRLIEVRDGPWGGFCRDSACKSIVRYPELQCAADEPLCIGCWRSPKGRVLRIETIGETLENRIYYADWNGRRGWVGCG